MAATRLLELFPNARSKWSLTFLANEMAPHHVEITFRVKHIWAEEPPIEKRDSWEHPVEMVRSMGPLNCPSRYP